MMNSSSLQFFWNLVILKFMNQSWFNGLTAMQGAAAHHLFETTRTYPGSMATTFFILIQLKQPCDGLL
jgi:hypothetical protein